MCKEMVACISPDRVARREAVSSRSCWAVSARSKAARASAKRSSRKDRSPSPKLGWSMRYAPTLEATPPVTCAIVRGWLTYTQTMKAA